MNTRRTNSLIVTSKIGHLYQTKHASMTKIRKNLILSIVVLSSFLLTGCPPKYEYRVHYHTRAENRGIQTDNAYYDIGTTLPVFNNKRKRIYLLCSIGNKKQEATEVSFSDLLLTSPYDDFVLLRADSIVNQHAYSSGNLLLNPGQEKDVIYVFEGRKEITRKMFKDGLIVDTLTVNVKGTTDYAKMHAIDNRLK